MKQLLTKPTPLILTIMLFFFCVFLYGWTSAMSETFALSVRETCRALEPIRRAEYKGTEFENYNFYQSCVDNIYCTRSTKYCERRLK